MLSKKPKDILIGIGVVTLISACVSTIIFYYSNCDNWNTLVSSVVINLFCNIFIYWVTKKKTKQDLHLTRETTDKFIEGSFKTVNVPEARDALSTLENTLGETSLKTEVTGSIG